MWCFCHIWRYLQLLTAVLRSMSNFRADWKFLLSSQGVSACYSLGKDVAVCTGNYASLGMERYIWCVFHSCLGTHYGNVQDTHMNMGTQAELYHFIYFFLTSAFLKMWSLWYSQMFRKGLEGANGAETVLTGWHMPSILNPYSSDMKICLLQNMSVLQRQM